MRMLVNTFPLAFSPSEFYTWTSFSVPFTPLPLRVVIENRIKVVGTNVHSSAQGRDGKGPPAPNPFTLPGRTREARVGC